MLSLELPSDVSEYLKNQNFKLINGAVSVFTSRTASVHLVRGTFNSKASFGKVIQLYMDSSEVYSKFRYFDLNNEIIKKLGQHPSLVQMYHKVHEKSIDSLFAGMNKLQLLFVTEFCSGGSLQDLLLERQQVPLSENVIRGVYCQIVSALHFLHSKGVAHRNLKCSKVLFSDEARTVVKLADSGITRSCWSYKKIEPLLDVPSFCASAAYVAPEALEQELGAAKQRPYNLFRASVYSLGVILYAMSHSGRLPFREWNLRMWIQRQKTSAYELYREQLSPQLVQMIIEHLQPNPEKRLDISELLNYSWCQIEEY